jgi:hypothetical protein
MHNSRLQLPEIPSIQVRPNRAALSVVIDNVQVTARNGGMTGIKVTGYLLYPDNRNISGKKRISALNPGSTGSDNRDIKMNHLLSCVNTGISTTRTMNCYSGIGYLAQGTFQFSLNRTDIPLPLPAMVGSAIVGNTQRYFIQIRSTFLGPTFV